VQLILSALVWCTILSVEPAYRPVPMLDSDRFLAWSSRIEAVEERIKALRVEGKLEEASQYEFMQERLWEEWLRMYGGPAPRRINPLKPPA
jgi:hypothetical protein